MIEPIYLSIAGYKSIFSEQTVKISPLTILAGANSSGKSSFMQPLLLMKQTTEAPFDPGIFLLNGELVKLTSINQLFSYYGNEKSSNTFSITIEEDKYFESYSYKKDDDTKELSFDEVKMGNHENSVHFKNSDISDNPMNIMERFLSTPTESAVYRYKSFIVYDKGVLNLSIIMLITSRIIYLPGLRGNRERNYPVSSSIDKTLSPVASNNFTHHSAFPGKFENYIASILFYWSSTSGKEENIKIIEDQLYLLGLNPNLKIEKINDVNIEISISRLNKKDEADFVNIADVGLGVSQVLPILVALLVAEKEQIVYIEQPELHLHPKAQLALAEIIADAAKRDVRVVIETHSSLLILGIQTLVAKNELDRELVALHWFTRDQNTGETTVTQAELDENGAFGDWPEDFDDIALQAEQNYLDAVEAKQYASH